jgi:hypothetical protein
VAEEIWCSRDGALVGVLHEAEPSNSPIALLLTAGYLPRPGPHRIYVKLARRLAQVGVSSLRFDFFGVGDSKAHAGQNERLGMHGWGTQDTTEVLATQPAADIRCAIDDLCELHPQRRFLLFAMCRSVEPALAVALQDPRVAGLFLVNGALVSSMSSKPVRHDLRHETHRRYYVSHLKSWKSWVRFLTGRSRYRAVLEAFLPTARKRRQERLLANRPRTSDLWTRLQHAKVPTRIVYSEGSPNWDDFMELHLPSLQRASVPHVLWEVIPKADHTFTPLWSQEALVRDFEAWVRATFPTSRRSA